MGAGGAEIQSGSEAAAGGREGQRTEDESQPSARPQAELLSERNVHINGSSVVSTATQPPSPSDPHARVKHNRPGGNSHPGQTQDRCDGRLNRLPPADVYGPGPDREAARQHVNSAHQMKSLSVRKHAELRRASPEKPGRRSLQLSPGHIWTAVHTNLRGPGTRTHQLPPHKVGFDIPEASKSWKFTVMYSEIRQFSMSPRNRTLPSCLWLIHTTNIRNQDPLIYPDVNRKSKLFTSSSVFFPLRFIMPD